MIQEEINHISSLNLVHSRLVNLQFCLEENDKVADAKTVQQTIHKLKKKIDELLIRSVDNWSQSAVRFVAECRDMSAKVEEYTNDIQKRIQSAEKVVAALRVVKQIADKIDGFI